MLYSTICYQVRVDKEFSDEFQSIIGILTGDSGSPNFWNIFLSDFSPPLHASDIIFRNVPMANLEQADDMVLFSPSFAGLQMKLDYLRR